MKLLRSFPLMVVGLVMLSIVGLCAAQRSVAMLVIGITLAVVSWYVTEGPRGRTLPRWASNGLVLAVTVGVLLDLLWSPGDVLDVLARFIIWLTIIKLYDRRSARDHAYLIALSLLLMLVGCLKTDELLFGVVLIAYAVLGLYVLLLYQLYAAHERAVEAHRRALGAAGTNAPAPGTVVAPTMSPRTTLQFRVLAGVVAAVGLTLSSLLFVIFPRTMGRGMISPRLQDRFGASTSGYTDEIDLDVGARITLSRRPVFELEVTDAGGLPVRRHRPLLLRGAVLDVYSGGRWIGGGARTREVHTDGSSSLSLVTDPPRGPMLRQHYRFREATTTVFALSFPVAVATESPFRFAFAPDTQTLRGADDWALWEYTIESRIAPPEPIDTEATGGPLAPAGSHPGGTDTPEARIAAYARGLLARSGLPARAPPDDPWRWSRDAAAVLAGHLRSDAFQYTVDLTDVVRRGDDPIAEFLLERRRGHCEYFASALAAMCRGVGIDARVVTGYVAVEFDEGAARYVVRACHAHAWAEVRTGPDHYATFDPTPPGVLAPTTSRPAAFADRLSWLYERLESAWTTSIVQFDTRSQWRLFRSLDATLSSRLRALQRSAREWASQVNRAFNVGPGGYIWLGIVAVVVVIAIVALVSVVRRFRTLRRALRIRRLPRTDARRVMGQLGFYVDMLDTLRRGGCPKPAWQPPGDFARGLAATRPRVADTVGRITALFYRARYGGHRLSDAELAGARRELRELGKTLARPAGEAS
jgi:transglutaminase-like putative cysteine protease